MAGRLTGLCVRGIRKPPTNSKNFMTCGLAGITNQSQSATSHTLRLSTKTLESPFSRHLQTAQVRHYQYMISFHTGDKPGAGTDANVFVVMSGEFGKSKRFKLSGMPEYVAINPTKRYAPKVKMGNDLERATITNYLINTNDFLGRINQLDLRIDMTGLFPSWYLDKAIVVDLEGRRAYDFMCSEWIPKDRDARPTTSLTNPLEIEWNEPVDNKDIRSEEREAIIPDLIKP